MYPTPVSEFFPKALQNNDNPSGDALATEFDTIIAEMKSLILGIENLRHADYCPNVLLPDLADKFAAPIRPGDDEALKRQKIRRAVETHKKSGRWSVHVKLIIDSITGFSASLVEDIATSNLWVLRGAAIDLTPSLRATLGRSTSFAGGMLLSGHPNSADTPGNILIDLGSDSIPSDTIDEVVEEIKDDIIPGYYRVLLGYLDGSSRFVPYANGIIDETV